MRHRTYLFIKNLALCLLMTGYALPTSANDSVAIGCKRLSVLLDPRLTTEIVYSEWGQGNDHTEAKAKLNLQGCNGELLDQLTLASPLARLNPEPVLGISQPTYLVSADLTQEAGSYNGPMTIAVSIINDRLHPVVTRSSDGQTEPIILPQTGKADWQKVTRKGVDHFYAIASSKEHEQFITTYRHYRAVDQAWEVKTRVVQGFWESDMPFPDLQSFP